MHFAHTMQIANIYKQITQLTYEHVLPNVNTYGELNP
jgi:hypothetical protein